MQVSRSVPWRYGHILQRGQKGHLRPRITPLSSRPNSPARPSPHFPSHKGEVGRCKFSPRVIAFFAVTLIFKDDMPGGGGGGRGGRRGVCSVARAMLYEAGP